MVVFTKSGDSGETSLKGFKRYLKSDPVFEVLGDLDELNCELGLVISSVNFTSEANDFLFEVQKALFRIGAEIAKSENHNCDFTWLESDTLDLENKILELEEILPILTNFILPGGTFEAVLVHRTRAICRRLERKIVKYCTTERTEPPKALLSYINRLSDFLFSLARFINFSSDTDETIWRDDSK